MLLHDSVHKVTFSSLHSSHQDVGYFQKFLVRNGTLTALQKSLISHSL